MKTLTDDELALLQGLIDYWQDHANRCDNVANRRMAEWQKGQDLARVELLKKLWGLARMAGDFAEGYQLVSSHATAAAAERDRARLCLLGVATSIGIEPDTQDGEAASASWGRLMARINGHFQIDTWPKEESHERP
jgi:hypothetical protein